MVVDHGNSSTLKCGSQVKLYFGRAGRKLESPWQNRFSLGSAVVDGDHIVISAYTMV